ncbi:hypothetical protein RHMOL_Rhmol03G0078300 [Rhododendron molle]|uniref:Uncharacterized protein n=1 Tax=Rhododendron molle TaxID=49168 RepID=A0ACC0PCW9_RHOML|nr:hypothetical protein RHMOL_Rhmol03G0078300 [Rhododendron molle]
MIGHIPRSANQCADHLAGMRAEHTEDLVFVMDMPIEMREFVIRDSSDKCLIRSRALMHMGIKTLAVLFMRYFLS